jgi:hypothetical protein
MANHAGLKWIVSRDLPRRLGGAGDHVRISPGESCAPEPCGASPGSARKWQLRRRGADALADGPSTPRPDLRQA